MPSITIRPRLSYDNRQLSSAPLPPSLPPRASPISPTQSSPSSPARRSKPGLHLNTIPSEDLLALFSRTPGFGRATANRLISSRESNGPFRTALDIDNVLQISYARLASTFSISLAHPAVLPATPPSPLPSQSPPPPARPQPSPAPDVVFLTFNTCRMSPRAHSFTSKLLCITRLVLDTPNLSLLCLQELFGASAGLIALHLSQSTGHSWSAIGCGADASASSPTHAHAKAHGTSCAASVFRTAHLRPRAQSYARGGPFKRPPHVVVFENIRSPHTGRLLAIANLHVSFSNPGVELQQLDSLVEAVRVATSRCFRLRGVTGLCADDVATVVLGDFNKGAASSHFGPLHDAGFIELVGGGAEKEGVDFLTEATSVAGSMLDNIFVAKAMRSEIVDAWVYRPGGAGRKLGESGHKSAGRLRSERSDHLPIVASLRLGTVGHRADGEGEVGEWTCRDAQFEVVLK